MKKIHIDQSIFIKTIDSYALLNRDILNAIDKMPKSTLDNVTKTDYNIENTEREYWEILFPYLKNSIESVCIDLNCNSWQIENYWFQQYSQNSSHDWHTHDRCNYAFVYFVEVNEKNITRFIDSTNDKIYTIPAKEKDLIAFPAHIPHSSPINTENRKTIVAFNVSFKL